MSQSATMFSLLTSLRSSPARLATPIMAIFSLSFGEIFRACIGRLASHAPAAAAVVCLMNCRRLSEWFINLYGDRLLSRQFANVDITEPDRTLVRLQLDLARPVNRPLAFPVVFQRHVVHYQRVVEIDRDLVAGHENVEMVPLARIVVGQFHGGVGILLIVVKTAGTFVFWVGFAAGRVPDLHLGTAAQVSTAVPAFVDFPVRQHVKSGL